MQIGDILQDRIKQYEKLGGEALKIESKDYQKKWAFAVKCFTDRINKDRKASGLKPLTFIAVRQKLVALREIDDLRWFYRECLRYSTTYAKEKDIKGKPLRHTFSQCFFGSLRIK